MVLKGKARVINTEGEDVTDFFIRGAEQALKLAEINRAGGAILKSGSPSCGTDRIYDGRFQNKQVEGCGVTAALLVNHGLKVISEKAISAEIHRNNLQNAPVDTEKRVCYDLFNI